MTERQSHAARAPYWIFLGCLLLLAAASFLAGRPATADNSFLPGSNPAVFATRPNNPPPDPDDPPPGGCSNTSTGLVPLIDMARGGYQGFEGGLYPDGNGIPNAHLQIGMGASQDVEPLNEQGQPDVNGRIVFLSVGMSNVKQEFGEFMNVARVHTPREVSMVNGGQTNYDAEQVANPSSDYWTKIDEMLNDRGMSPAQVQVIWLKEAVALETADFPQDALRLQGFLRSIILIAENRYPNLEIVYLSSRIYGGYAGPNAASPEPWAYQSGFSVKWLIESQIEGSDPALAYHNTPWLAWGPYMWADGLDARSDGLIWECSDFQNDGVHPSPSGEAKVAAALLDFFLLHPTAGWFTN